MQKLKKAEHLFSCYTNLRQPKYSCCLLLVLSTVSTLVLSVGLVEALRVDEADSPQAQCVLLRQQVGLAVSKLLIGHQGVVAVAHSHVCLQVGQLLGHLRLLPLQEL